MPWWQFLALGAVGGAVVEVLAIFGCTAKWQEARKDEDGTIRTDPPPLHRYVDFPAHALMLAARVGLGVGAAILCGETGQITGPYGAVAIGCAAPVLLAQLGSIPQVARAVTGSVQTHQQAVLPALDTDELPASTAFPLERGSTKS